MLIRTLYKPQLTSLICFSVGLSRQPVQRYFNNNFKAARDQIQKISTQFNMSREQSRRLFHFYPKVFKPDTKQFQEFKERVSWVKTFSNAEDNKGIGKVIDKFLFDSNHLAFTMDKPHFEKFAQALRENFQSEAQLETIFSKCPNLINAKLPEILQEKLNLLQDYLGVNKQEAMKIFEASPFLLCGSTRKIKESILILIHRFGLSKEQVVEHMKTLGQVYLFGQDTLLSILRVPSRWGLTQQELKQVFLKNPLLFFNYPIDVMPYKRKIIRHLRFTQQMGKLMLQKYPQILISSVRSFEEKALFITNRLQLKLNPDNLELLTFNFNKTLRPRGQILKKTQTFYDSQKIVEFMKLTNQEFMSQLNIPIEKLNEEIAKYPISLEMDFKKGKIAQKLNLKQKLMKLAQVYQR